MEVNKIYFDMDGVLADFDRGVRELGGYEPRFPQDTNPEEEAIMWARVKEIPHFYDRLELMPGAKEMFDAVYGKYAEKCEILTGVPKAKRGIIGAAEDKINWMRRMLSEDIAINTVSKADKKFFCKGEGYILIDDLEPTIKIWNECGGTGILHKSSDETVQTLKELGIL